MHVVAIRSNHAVWRCQVGKQFAAIDGVNLSAYESDGKTELRYVP